MNREQKVSQKRGAVMAMPLISVIMPTYNRCDMLRGALETLLIQQTRNDFDYEVIVVDNASTDATREVVEQAAKAGQVAVKYVYHAVPGPAPARNAGLAEAPENGWPSLTTTSWPRRTGSGNFIKLPGR